MNEYFHNDGFTQLSNSYDTDYYYIMHLTESNHFSYIFDKCINDVFYNYKDYISDEYIDTSWKYDNKTYSINKDNGFPIYIRVTTQLQPHIVGSTKMRDLSNNKIYISLNKSYSKQTLRSFLQHELIHAIKMYANDNKNLILNNKDRIGYNISNYIEEFNITDSNYKNYLNLLYILSKTEMEASINATCRFVQDLTNEQIQQYIIDRYEYMCKFQKEYSVKDILGKQQQISNLLSYTKDTHYINRYIILIDALNDYNEYNKDFILFIGYYLQQHKLYKGNKEYICFDFIYAWIHRLFTEHQNEYFMKYKVIKQECNNIINKINSIYDNYRNRLYDAIYAILIEKDAFLSKYDLKMILPYHMIQC